MAETGSMTDAAQLLSVSHSAVSQSIKIRIPARAKLFIIAGPLLQANRACSGTNRIATEKLIEQQHSQRITLNMVNSLVMHWWIPHVDRFNQFAPNIDIRISNLTGRFKMESEGIDVAIIHGNTHDWSDYYCELLAADELVLTPPN